MRNETMTHFGALGFGGLLVKSTESEVARAGVPPCTLAETLRMVSVDERQSGS
jgi:hypothetical protein